MKCEHGIYIGASDKIAIYCPLCNPSGPDSLFDFAHPSWYSKHGGKI